MAQIQKTSTNLHFVGVTERVVNDIAGTATPLRLADVQIKATVAAAADTIAVKQILDDKVSEIIEVTGTACIAITHGGTTLTSTAAGTVHCCARVVLT